ncbi:alkaline phosphatase family protein [Methanobacterium sp. YSL]|nr:alkaline phosphatase family protein [Methanobacterium sp. YSL]
MFPNYKESILNISNTLLEHYGIPPHHETLALLKPYLTGKKHIMLILLDGMGMNILNNLSPNSYLRKHVKTQLTSVYPPTTVAATTSVLSGLTPYEHGHVGWTQYNRFENCHTVVFQNKDFYDENHHLQTHFKNTHLKYETILEKIQQQHPNLLVKKLFPDFDPEGYAQFPDMIDELIRISHEEASFTYTYWTEPDYTIHDFGTHNDTVKNKLMTLNDEIERLHQSVSKDCLIMVIADHGLIDVTGITLIHHPILEHCSKMPSLEPRSTAFYIKPGHEQAFEQDFQSYFGAFFKLYTQQQVLDSGMLGSGQQHPLLTDFIGDYLAISEQHYMFNIKETSSFKAHHAGMHPDEMWVPLILLET